MPSTSYIDFPAAVYALQDRTNAAGVDQLDVTGEDLRALASLFGPGVYQPDGFAIASGAGLSVDVGTSADDVAVVPGTDPGQGHYVVRMGAAPPYNVLLQAAHASNDRLDQIYLAVLDQQYDGGSLTLARIARRTGDDAASPTEPGPDAAWSAYLLLATVLVENGDTSVTPGNITVEAGPVSLQVPGRGAPGVVDMYAGSAIPADALLCNGQAVSRATYARLFAAIGTTWGVGDGSTTFNVPNLVDRFPRGAGATALGVGGGSDLIVDHDHPVDPPSTTSGVPTGITNSGNGHTTRGLYSRSDLQISDPVPFAFDHTHATNISPFNTGAVNGTNPQQVPAHRGIHFIIWT